MKQFGYAIAADFAAAAEALSKAPNSVAKAGGTDLLDLLKERIYEPDETIHLGQAKNEVPAGELNALATLAEVAVDARLRRDFPALAEAAEVAATPQIRNWATVGGNLCQHTRCWYFRNKDFLCFKRGDEDCNHKRWTLPIVQQIGADHHQHGNQEEAEDKFLIDARADAQGGVRDPAIGRPASPGQELDAAGDHDRQRPED